MKYRNKKLLCIIGITLLLWVLVGIDVSAGDRRILTQISTIDALMTGIYDGDTKLSILRERGDFGLGTFNSLDGEMILLDGRFYQVKASGVVAEPTMEARTPFAAVTTFAANRTIPLSKGQRFNGVTELVDSMLPTTNIFYAVKITGHFQLVKTRSVPSQPKPYRPLIEVVKTQPVFTLSDMDGTVIGFRSPAYTKGLAVPGYHLHFISADRKTGGHILDFVVEHGKAEIADISALFLILPSDKAFYTADLTGNKEKEVKAVEK